MAYAVIRKRKRLANPGRRKRKLSPKQIAIFGTKRQKAALRAHRGRKSNPRRRRNISIRKQAKLRIMHGPAGRGTHPGFLRKRARARKRSRRKNVGSILVA